MRQPGARWIVRPSTGTNLVCRLVQIALALYLIPAFLIVLLVGAVGMLVVGMVRLFTRLLARPRAGQKLGTVLILPLAV